MAREYFPSDFAPRAQPPSAAKVSEPKQPQVVVANSKPPIRRSLPPRAAKNKAAAVLKGGVEKKKPATVKAGSDGKKPMEVKLSEITSRDSVPLRFSILV